jgi:hypothetical protein
MSRNHIYAGAAIAASAAVVGIGALQASGQATPTAASIDTPRTLTLSTPFEGGKSRHIDVGKKGLGPGDLSFSTDIPVRDEQTGRRAGELDGMEMILSPAHNGTVHLSAALRLPDGTIELAGTLRHTDPGEPLAIIGGTGAYANARGDVTTREDGGRKVNVMTVNLLP